MITTLDNDDGLIYAFMEWETVDGEGQYNSKGRYLYVKKVWVHPGFRSNGRTFKRLQLKVLSNDKAKATTQVYWENEKHGDRPMQIVDKERFLRGVYEKAA